MIFIALVLLSSLIAAEVEEEVKELNILWDEKLLELRWQIFKTEGETLTKVDSLFFEHYSEILDRYMVTFDKEKSKWMRHCANFSEDERGEEIEFNTYRKFLNLCDLIENFLERSSKYAKNYLLGIYTGGLLTENLLQLNSRNLYTYAVERFEFIIPMYHHNSSCVATKFQRLSEIYENYGYNIKVICERFKRFLPQATEQFYMTFENILRLIHRAEYKLDLCIKSLDITGCLEEILNNFCISPRHCSLQFRFLKTMKETYKTFKGHQDFHYNLLHVRYNQIMQLAGNFSDVLIDWENEVETCLVPE